MKWLRLYHDLLNDPKVQRLDSETFKRWINLLCLASMNDQRGELPSDIDCAFALRINDVSSMRATIKTLVEAGLIERHGNTLRIHGWHARQHASDTSTDRVRRHRDRAKAVESREETDGETPCNVTATLHETPRNESETSPKRYSNGPDTDTDTDTEADTEADADAEVSASPSRSPKRSARASPAKPSKDWKPRNEHEKLIAWWAEFSGAGMPTVFGKAVSAAKRLTDAGLTLDDAPDLYGFCASFMDGITLEKMLGQFDAWKAAKSAPARRPPQRRRKDVGLSLEELIAHGMEGDT